MISKTVSALIWLYQATLSPLLGSKCKFHPSCSNYCRDAFQEHPPYKALRLVFKRILRCHPWNRDGGFDPVPKSD